jgi:hypothetical protein
MVDMPKDLGEALSDLEEAQGNKEWPADRVILGYQLRCTCPACPEQYDVLTADGNKIGYLRLRHGWFRADAPACGGETVYESNPNGDGMFDDDERVPELTKAVEAIQAWWKTHES